MRLASAHQATVPQAVRSAFSGTPVTAAAPHLARVLAAASAQSYGPFVPDPLQARPGACGHPHPGPTRRSPVPALGPAQGRAWRPPRILASPDSRKVPETGSQGWEPKMA